jgi:hypothetical protein
VLDFAGLWDHRQPSEAQSESSAAQLSDGVHRYDGVYVPLLVDDITDTMQTFEDWAGYLSLSHTRYFPAQRVMLEKIPGTDWPAIVEWMVCR